MALTRESGAAGSLLLSPAGSQLREKEIMRERSREREEEKKRSSPRYPAIHSRFARTHFALRDETLRCAASVRYIGSQNHDFVLAIDTGDKRRTAAAVAAGKWSERGGEGEKEGRRAIGSKRGGSKRASWRPCPVRWLEIASSSFGIEFNFAAYNRELH